MLREVTKKKITYLLSKKSIRDIDVYTLLKEFFKEYLEAHYEFTFDELHDELTKIYLDHKVKNKLIEMIDKFRAVEYQDEDVPQDVLRDVLNSFNLLVNNLIQAEEKKGFFDKLMGKDMPFRKAEIALQQNETTPSAQDQNTRPLSSRTYSLQQANPSNTTSNSQDIEQQDTITHSLGPQTKSENSTEQTTQKEKKIPEKTSVQSINTTKPSEENMRLTEQVEKTQLKNIVSEPAKKISIQKKNTEKKTNSLYKTFDNMKKFVKRTSKPLTDWTQTPEKKTEPTPNTSTSWSSIHSILPSQRTQKEKEGKTEEKTAINNLLPPEQKTQNSQEKILETNVKTQLQHTSPHTQETVSQTQKNTEPHAETTPTNNIKKTSPEVFDLTGKSNEVDLDSLAKELDSVISGEVSVKNLTPIAPLTPGQTHNSHEDLSLMFSQTQSLIDANDLKGARKKYAELLQHYEKLSEEAKHQWYDQVQKIYDILH